MLIKRERYWLGILYSVLHPPFQRLGSSANLGIVSIPEGANGFRIVREWTRSVCHDHNYNSGPVNPIAQWFTVACVLAFDLDKENARNFVPRVPLYRSAREEGNSTIQDLITFLTAKVYQSLTYGSSYLRCVWRDT